MKKLLLATGLLVASSFSYAYDAPHADIAPIIDGSADDSAWQKAPWHAIDQLILGVQPSTEDFLGRFKMVWTEDKLYLMGEIVDDVLIDSNADPLLKYWEDDIFEFFIDENKSGGDHLESHNAFAYHISLDNQAVDYSTKGKPAYYNDHINSVWKRSAENPHKVVWEVSFDIYPDTFKDEGNTAKPLKLSVGKKMGFLVAYCDSDNATDGRQSFIGSFDVPAIDGDKNRGYKDASVFDSLKLVK